MVFATTRCPSRASPRRRTTRRWPLPPPQTHTNTQANYETARHSPFCFANKIPHYCNKTKGKVSWIFATWKISGRPADVYFAIVQLRFILQNSFRLAKTLNIPTKKWRFERIIVWMDSKKGHSNVRQRQVLLKILASHSLHDTDWNSPWQACPRHFERAGLLLLVGWMLAVVVVVLLLRGRVRGGVVLGGGARMPSWRQQRHRLGLVGAPLVLAVLLGGAGVYHGACKPVERICRLGSEFSKQMGGCVRVNRHFPWC